MERHGFHIVISIQASDAKIMNTRTGGQAVVRSTVPKGYIIIASRYTLQVHLFMKIDILITLSFSESNTH